MYMSLSTLILILFPYNIAATSGQLQQLAIFITHRNEVNSVTTAACFSVLFVYSVSNSVCVCLYVTCVCLYVTCMCVYVCLHVYMCVMRVCVCVCIQLLVHIMIWLQIIVFVLYSLLQRRRALCQNCCFGGHCGLPMYAIKSDSQPFTLHHCCTHRPINFINETKDRWVYCAAFGMMVNLFISVVVKVSGGGSASSLLSGL